MTPVPVKLAYLKDEELNFETVSAAQDDGDSLQFIRALEVDAPVAALGLDTYCLVLGDGPSTYGGLDSISADTVNGVQVLTLTLAAVAAAELGIDSVIELAVDPDELRSVLPDLLRILELSRAPGD